LMCQLYDLGKDVSVAVGIMAGACGRG
jgi:hypothetical protein